MGSRLDFDVGPRVTQGDRQVRVLTARQSRFGPNGYAPLRVGPGDAGNEGMVVEAVCVFQTGNVDSVSHSRSSRLYIYSH